MRYEPHLSAYASVNRVPPRGEAPMSNSACSFEFGMPVAALKACTQDHPLVVSLRVKDRFQEREVSLAPSIQLSI
jgi:hypothetical protein